MHTNRPRVVIPPEVPFVTGAAYNSPPPPFFEPTPSPAAYYRSQRYHSKEGISPVRPSYSYSPSSPRSQRPRVIPCQTCPSPRRTRTASHPAGIHLRRSGSNREPWEHMAQTYAWVFEQEIAEMSRKNEETVRWILKQKERDAREQTFFTRVTIEQNYRGRTSVEELLYDSEDEGTRRSTKHWQREMERMVQEEIRRMAGRRREAEKHRNIHEMRKARDQAKERERLDQEKARLRRKEVESKAWEVYETRWNQITSNSDLVEPLKFDEIPWPVLDRPRTVGDITPARVTMFLLSSHHSESQSRKERIKSALRRWHPDRFGRVLAKVRDDDRAKVEEGAGIVVRCLNNLLEREG
ncbi:unnamed protein product [Somion occarium]|uniref:Uncharacterized protein n=1 Tax=Somion occarium TaxID=3059160 RepID=A0ABP1DKF4_9APHY